ncbi:Pre-rRNA-processing protein TSR2 [Colletotrichum sojae]|uniref:Pre-rRNA-processing protein TSR2 n=1 Tax=Colletotrichum sojae TaxID=2175907 RepID=A0A8H6MZE8_9PEZI|nr:Pre-rRNA-processing protein TSR2 [Colletotrichum sojae]
MATAGSSSPITPEACQSTFEQAVALSLHIWPALTAAVQNNWGGPDSADKRDWFAGVVVDLFPPYTRIVDGQAAAASDAPEEPDTLYVEDLLLQVMGDEFEVNIEDETSFDVAERIIQLRAECAKGNFEAVEDLRKKWNSRKGAKIEVNYKKTSEESEDSEDDDEDDEEDEDVEMDEAPQLVAVPKEKPQPEVDEDGFTMVTKKKR